VNYLMAHGIDSLRLTPVGYGEKRPKIVTRRIASTHDFLTEGDTLTEAFIQQFAEDEEKQEICNALNRRTEFKVLRTTYRLFDEETPPAQAEEAAPEAAPEGQEAEQETEEKPEAPAEDQPEAQPEAKAEEEDPKNAS
jgi:hypothetical protein